MLVVTRFREGAEEPAVVLLPDVTGTPHALTFVFNQLACNSLGTIYGIYAKPAHDAIKRNDKNISHTNETEITSIEDYAKKTDITSIKAYAKEIATAIKDFPENHIVLAGYSWGGYLIPEIIKAVGDAKTIVRVIIIDTDLSLLPTWALRNGQAKSKTYNKFRENVKNLLTYCFNNIPEYLDLNNEVKTILGHVQVSELLADKNKQMKMHEQPLKEQCLKLVKICFFNIKAWYENKSEEQQQLLSVFVRYLQLVIEPNLLMLCHADLNTENIFDSIPFSVFYASERDIEKTSDLDWKKMIPSIPDKSIIALEGNHHKILLTKLLSKKLSEALSDAQKTRHGLIACCKHYLAMQQNSQDNKGMPLLTLMTALLSSIMDINNKQDMLMLIMTCMANLQLPKKSPPTKKASNRLSQSGSNIPTNSSVPFTLFGSSSSSKTLERSSSFYDSNEKGNTSFVSECKLC